MNENQRAHRRLPVGAEVIDDRAVRFRVWAPNCRRVDLVVPDLSERGPPREIMLDAEGNGYFSRWVSDLGTGALYGFRLNGAGRLFPDPASRFQPQGPEGLSQVIDGRQFPWSDAKWRGTQVRG